ncbi:uncharacterized protein LOC120685486 [Panicum virgatum]|uniref:uncharacterized protein LOC120685486 n=1 Tax=Panicum virgatum TaxID=38727 RepID=UPI0019D63ABB|nr:uncharacterized protein LOC120685486 [Panicum virgatum]
MAIFFLPAPVRCAGTGGCCWSGVREKYCWLVGGWRLLLEWCERKTMLAGAGAEQPNRVWSKGCIVDAFLSYMFYCVMQAYSRTPFPVSVASSAKTVHFCVFYSAHMQN